MGSPLTPNKILNDVASRAQVNKAVSFSTTRKNSVVFKLMFVYWCSRVQYECFCFALANVYFGLLAGSRHIFGGANQRKPGRMNQTWSGANRLEMNVPLGESAGYQNLNVAIFYMTWKSHL